MLMLGDLSVVARCEKLAGQPFGLVGLRRLRRGRGRGRGVVRLAAWPVPRSGILDDARSRSPRRRRPDRGVATRGHRGGSGGISGGCSGGLAHRLEKSRRVRHINMRRMSGRGNFSLLCGPGRMSSRTCSKPAIPRGAGAHRCQRIVSVLIMTAWAATASRSLHSGHNRTLSRGKAMSDTLASLRRKIDGAGICNPSSGR